MKARTFFVKEGEPDFLTENRLQKTFRKRKSHRPYPCFPFLISLFAPLFLFLQREKAAKETRSSVYLLLWSSATAPSW